MAARVVEDVLLGPEGTLNPKTVAAIEKVERLIAYLKDIVTKEQLSHAEAEGLDLTQGGLRLKAQCGTRFLKHPNVEEKLLFETDRLKALKLGLPFHKTSKPKISNKKEVEELVKKLKLQISAAKIDILRLTAENHRLRAEIRSISQT